MAEQYPNPIPIYTVGDASLAPSSTISSNATDADGGDAVEIYRVSDPFFFILMRKIFIYSRGTNGAGTAYLWVDDASNGTKECISQISWVSTDRGLVRDANGDVVYFDLMGEDAESEELRGYIARSETRFYVQISDALMSGGYRTHPEVRNLTRRDGFENVD